ncbi:hypothetical protein [Sporomusa acidovorans]|uniref:Uncharacterized protein n=1 Tax=Sporomusa acidovorans (strain ATCC 49682 / DSM 3132 / Mol) TaxID=1123286 RepID=A0ABZ3JAA3_SPOA4|nr:hypothetical protein [Sporomusa acidovorans]OZC13326.1 hypothetical protein SPACI_58220 [Sporomusa acidovorans DSM 3132]SDD96485.1 hypothetical protein SAMN04488499_100626 [Sporomusa acidovorans]
MKSSGSYGEKYGKTLPRAEAKFITGNVGVQENPDAPPEKKENHTIEPPKNSTQHF